MTSRPLPPPTAAVTGLAAPHGGLLMAKDWYDYFQSGGSYGRFLAGGSFDGVPDISLTLTAWSEFRALKFVLVSVTVSTDTSIRILTNSTGSLDVFDTGGSDYGWRLADGGSDATSDNIVTGLDIDSDAGMSGNLDVTLFDPANDELWTQLYFHGVGLTGSGDAPELVSGSGVRQAAAAVKAIRFRPDAGTFSGRYAVFGMA